MKLLIRVTSVVDVAGRRPVSSGLGRFANRWWPAGETTEELSRQLEWIVLQIHVKADAYFVRHPLPRAAIGG